ncbi:hypothetical protein B0H21DRAFT_712971 [Amylocystis lapponica]|nr:hypothetical protein B0H21DRAFT_712971 [Amylocystis lapponica]
MGKTARIPNPTDNNYNAQGDSERMRSGNTLYLHSKGTIRQTKAAKCMISREQVGVGRLGRIEPTDGEPGTNQIKITKLRFSRRQQQIGFPIQSPAYSRRSIVVFVMFRMRSKGPLNTAAKSTNHSGLRAHSACTAVYHGDLDNAFNVYCNARLKPCRGHRSNTTAEHQRQTLTYGCGSAEVVSGAAQIIESLSWTAPLINVLLDDS